MAQDASVNSGAGPRADIARDRVARTQIKYHRWAKTDRSARHRDTGSYTRPGPPVARRGRSQATSPATPMTFGCRLRPRAHHADPPSDSTPRSRRWPRWVDHHS